MNAYNVKQTKFPLCSYFTVSRLSFRPAKETDRKIKFDFTQRLGSLWDPLGLFTWREKHPRKRTILAPYVFCIQFTRKELYLSLTLGFSQLRGRKILVIGMYSAFAVKILTLGTNQRRMSAGRQWLSTAIPQADYCNSSAERWSLAEAKRAEGPKLHFVFVARHF